MADDEETWRAPTRLEQLRRLYREESWRAWEAWEAKGKETAATVPLPAAMSTSWLADQARASV